MNCHFGQREVAEVIRVARQASSAAGVGQEVTAFRRALGLILPPLAFGRPTATVKGLAGNEEQMPARRVAIGRWPPSAIRRPSLLFNRVTFGIAHVLGVLPDALFQYRTHQGWRHESDRSAGVWLGWRARAA